MSHYQLLGISSDASDGDIRKAYRKRAKELHPDVNPSKEAALEFVALREAYEILLDVNKRFIYDASHSAVVGSRNVSAYIKGAKQYSFIPNYEQWIAIKKEKLKKTKEEEIYQFNERRQSIRQSTFFAWLRAWFYLKIAGISLCSVLLLFGGCLIIIKTHLLFIFIVLPLWCAGGFGFIWAYTIYKQQVGLYQ